MSIKSEQHNPVEAETLVAVDSTTAGENEILKELLTINVSRLLANVS